MQRQAFFRKKVETFRQYGEVFVMKECTWKRQLMTMEKPQTQMGRILETDNQDSLLEAILNDQVFGFVRCDIETPTEQIEQFGEFLFPPLFCRMQITPDMLSDYMKKRLIEEEKSKYPKTIVQRYNAKDIYLMTPLVKFYASRGMKISNITRFEQYIGGKVFDSYVEKCYLERVAATKENDITKANTIKVVQNSGEYIFIFHSLWCVMFISYLGYGKCGENIRRHKKHVIILDEDKLKKQEAKPRYLQTTNLLNESGAPECWEVSTSKKFVDDDKPVHFSLAILQYSKLMFLE